jgi:hypothetical protein
MTTDIPIYRRKILIALCLGSLLAAFLVMNAASLDWPFGIIDSPILLAHAIKYSPLEYFTTPFKYQFLTYNNLTPWVTFSWDIDYYLFDLSPFGYRLHHITSGAILLGLIYYTLYRLSGSLVNACVFCFSFATLPATFFISDDLIYRHYLEGMILCLLSFLCAHQYNRSPRGIWLALSVLLYGFSMTTKEVYVPLPGILFFVFAGTIGRRILLILPYAFTLSAYLVWRIYMLGDLGGYNSPISPGSLIPVFSLVVFLAQYLSTSLFVTPQISLSILAIFTFLLLKNFHQLDISTKLGLSVGLVSLLAPFLGLALLLSMGYFSARWMFAPSVAFIIFFSYLTAIDNSKYLAGLVYILVFACSVYALNVRMHEEDKPYHAGKGKVYDYILAPNTDTYLHQRYSHLAARGVSTWRYIAFMRNGSWGPLVISDAGQLEYHDTADKTVTYFGKRKAKSDTMQHRDTKRLDLLEGIDFDRSDGMLTFHFDEILENSSCFIYIFGEHNGLLFDTENCDQWRFSARELAYLLEMAGYDLADASVALWSRNTDNKLFSRQYPLSEVLDLDLLQDGAGKPLL